MSEFDPTGGEKSADEMTDEEAAQAMINADLKATLEARASKAGVPKLPGPPDSDDDPPYPFQNPPESGLPEPGSKPASEYPAGALPLYQGPLPPDIEEVWGNGILDDTGQPAESTARVLIQTWGVERFRASGMHQLAVQEAGREAKMDPVRKAFIEAQRKKEKR